MSHDVSRVSPPARDAEINKFPPVLSKTNHYDVVLSEMWGWVSGTGNCEREFQKEMSEQRMRG